MLESRVFEFKVDYLETKDMAIGRFVSSRDISVGGHLWRVNCFPNGDWVDDNGK
jgi:speckle-type POZ protein